jgi:hypothetical protein
VTVARKIGIAYMQQEPADAETFLGPWWRSTELSEWSAGKFLGMKLVCGEIGAMLGFPPLCRVQVSLARFPGSKRLAWLDDAWHGPQPARFAGHDLQGTCRHEMWDCTVHALGLEKGRVERPQAIWVRVTAARKVPARYGVKALRQGLHPL